MAIINMNESQGGDFPQIPALPIGTYPAVISGVFDIGKQKKEWQGDVSIVNQILIRVEVSKKISAPGSEYDGKRYAPMSWVTVPRSFSDKANLVKIVGAALGKNLTADDFKAFDTDSLIGKNVVVTVGHTAGGKAKITGYSPEMEGMPEMKPELTPETPEWAKKLYNAGIEQSESDLPPVSAYNDVPAVPMDDLPF